MVARNPTSFNEWNDTTLARRGEILVPTFDDGWIDDMMYMLDRPQLIISDCWPKRGTSSASWTNFGIWLTESKDMLDEAGAGSEIAHDVYFLVESWGGVVNGDVRLVSGASSDATATVAIDMADSSPTWKKDTFNMRTNGTVETLTGALKTDAGGGFVHVYAILVVANET